MKHYTLFFTFCLLLCTACSSEKAYELHGPAIGTSYSIKYYGNKDLNNEIKQIINITNRSISTYQKDSDISKINRNNTSIEVDSIFKKVFNIAKKVHKTTNGYFDPTAGSLVNAWGFGPEKGVKTMDSTSVDSLMRYVGLNKVRLNSSKILKNHSNIYLDFNAIGKGYLVDLVAQCLEKHLIINYIVEIGGEIRAKGNNIEKQRDWIVGVEDPNEDGTRTANKTFPLINASMATSGNYRKYKKDSTGRKTVHTINPKTGFAQASDLLSVSVISTEGCAEADAYATAFMAMGVATTKKNIKHHKKVKAYLIYENVSKKLVGEWVE